MKTIAYTSFALLAFAANSILCRLALGQGAIDAASFTAIRLFSGALTLLLILHVASHHSRPDEQARIRSTGSWLSALCLFIYAVTFSYAYRWLDTGTGALVLFGAVQVSMIAISSFSGQRLRAFEWVGVAMAFFGLAFLLMPNVSSPSLVGFILMACAGIAWGVYSLRGRHSADPLRDTTFNFVRSGPAALLLIAFTYPEVDLSHFGIVLAILSGALASGVGYTIWYVALSGLSASEAAVVQLSVPAIAAVGGVIFVSEPITTRLAIAGALILSGILLVILTRRQSQTT